MKPKLYKSRLGTLFDAVLRSACDRALLERALLRLVEFFETEIDAARAKSNRLLRFNREMRKKLEERTDAKS